ncbi:MAG: HEAT repeat domain-containing protein [Acidobacteria bacterium]|nr:HEAT repeat domain-containing protein [Acidobacteriota bacterium]
MIYALLAGVALLSAAGCYRLIDRVYRRIGRSIVNSVFLADSEAAGAILGVWEIDGWSLGEHFLFEMRKAAGWDEVKRRCPDARRLMESDEGSVSAMIAGMGAPAVPVLRQIPHSITTTNQTRKSAIETLGMIRDRAAQEALVDALLDELPEVRRAALASLDGIDPIWPESEIARRIVPTFCATLRDGNPEIKRGSSVSTPRRMKRNSTSCTIHSRGAFSGGRVGSIGVGTGRGWRVTPERSR